MQISKIQFSQIPFGAIVPPDPRTLDSLGLNNLKYQFPIFTAKGHLLSSSACELLISAQPVFTWKNKAVAGLRTFYFCKNQLPDDFIVQVGVLPARTPEAEVIQFARNIEVLSIVTGTIKSPVPSVHSAIKSFNIDDMIPIFSESQRTIRQHLKTAERTLQVHMKRDG